jgi:hypothetical protein
MKDMGKARDFIGSFIPSSRPKKKKRDPIFSGPTSLYS